VGAPFNLRWGSCTNSGAVGYFLFRQSNFLVGTQRALAFHRDGVHDRLLAKARLRIRSVVMLTLYHCHNARSFRPLWTLEEMGLSYELKMLPFPPRQMAPDYLSINPLGTVPTFFDGTTRMTESSAICEYLVTRYGPTALAVAPTETEFGLYLNWLYFGEATLTFPQTLVLRYGMLEPPERRSEQVAGDYARWFLSRLRNVTTAVESRPTLCAGRFTVADISVGYAFLLAESIGLDAKFSPAVAAYWQSLKERDGFRRAMAAQDKAMAEQGVGKIEILQQRA
jgi:glutathione S-transferase